MHLLRSARPHLQTNRSAVGILAQVRLATTAKICRGVGVKLLLEHHFARGVAQNDLISTSRLSFKKFLLADFSWRCSSVTRMQELVSCE
jgi:hypothetical protein